MQVHEVTWPAVLDEGLMDKIKSFVDPSAQQQASQQKAAAQAAAAAPGVKARLDQQSQPAMNFDQLLKKTQTDPGTQTYIKGLSQDWKRQQKKPMAEAAPVSIGGQTIDPSDPLYSRIAQQTGLKTAAAASRGLDDPATLQKVLPALATAAKKTNNSISPTNLARTLAAAAPAVWRNTTDKPRAIAAITSALRKMNITVTGETGSTLKTQFQTWSDANLASRDPASGTAITMDMVRSEPAVAARLDQALDALVKANETTAFDQAFANYMNLAIAGIRLKTQEAQQKAPAAAKPTAPATTGTVQDDQLKNSLDSVGIDERQINKLGLALNLNNKRVRSTGNPQIDNLYRMMGATIA